MKYILIILSIVFFGLCTIPVMAQEVRMNLTPSLYEIKVKPGKSFVLNYSLANLSDPTAFQIKVLPFEPRENNDGIRLKNGFEGPIKFSLDDNTISLNQPFFLKSNTHFPLRLRIRIPDGAPEGDYYYSVIAQSQPAPSTDGTASVQIKTIIGSNILLTVTKDGVSNPQGKITTFDAFNGSLPILGKIKIYDSLEAVPLTLILNNTGNSFFSAAGVIQIRNFLHLGKNIALKNNRILANSQRKMTEQYNSYEPYSYVFKGIIGFYTVTAFINIDSDSLHLAKTTYFFIFPFKLTLLILILGTIFFKLRSFFKPKDLSKI